MTEEQARLIVDAHEIDKCMDDAEEVELMEENNPALLAAYKALLKFAGL